MSTKTKEATESPTYRERTLKTLKTNEMKTDTDNTAGSDCSGATCSRLIFQRRWYDSQWKRWDDWVDVEGRDLFKYGETPEEWISMAKSYIEMGATYEYRIIERTDKITWSVSYSANVEATDKPPES